MRGLILLFAWMLWGDFCFTLMENVAGSILPLKLRDLNSTNSLMGFVLTSMPAAFNFTITPILSFKSDRHRGPWGRRIPFILATMPFLTIALILIGFCDPIGEWAHRLFFAGGTVGQAKVTIMLLAVFAAVFDLFNMFVNTVYWYLFVDVVPQEWMGRFMGWFRVVSSLTVAAYQYWVYQYALTYMRYIFLGAALVYFLGFGIMCLCVKEGKYPPLEDPGKRLGLLKGFMKDLMVFVRECFTMRFYWDVFLTYSIMVIGGAIMVFYVFFQRSLGLDLDHIGKLGAIAAVVLPVYFVFAGKFVDKWHAMRVAAYLGAFGVFFILDPWIWLFIDPPSVTLFFWIWMLTSGVFRAPFRALDETAGATRLMVLLPKDRFGEYSGAMALVRAVAIFFGGWAAGVFLDLCKQVYPQGNYVYRLYFLWLAPFSILSFYFHYRTYRAWKRLGGAEGYSPPVHGFRLSELRPAPGDDGKVQWKLVAVTAWLFAGMEMGMLAYAAYSFFALHNTYYLYLFLIKSATDCLLYWAYIRFVQFMERP